MSLELIILGSGTSQGIPIIGCDCKVCKSKNPKDRRTRTSAVVNLDGFYVLIDATPEFRLQCLNSNIPRIDTVLITHTHADHFLGLDDIRRYNQIQGSPIDLYAHERHLSAIQNVFGYACAIQAGNNKDLPRLNYKTIQDTIELNGWPITPLKLAHGKEFVFGYRLGPIAYCTDVSEMPDEIISQLQGLDILVLGALRFTEHPKHFTIDQAITAAEKIGANQTYFVHMAHQISHDEVDAQLPDNIHLAYDNLRIKLETTHPKLNYKQKEEII